MRTLARNFSHKRWNKKYLTSPKGIFLLYHEDSMLGNDVRNIMVLHAKAEDADRQDVVDFIIGIDVLLQGDALCDCSFTLSTHQDYSEINKHMINWLEYTI